MARGCMPWLACCLAVGCLPDVGIDPEFDMNAGNLRTGGAAGMDGGQGGGGAGGAGGSVVNVPSPLPSNTTGYTPDRETACLDYCALYTTICAGHAANDYAGVLECTNICIDSLWPIGSLSRLELGSITCRYWHAGLAFDQGLNPHCYHAAREPTMGGCQVP